MPPPRISHTGVISSLLFACASPAFAAELTDTSTSDSTTEETTVFRCGEPGDPDDPGLLYLAWSESVDNGVGR